MYVKKSSRTNVLLDFQLFNKLKIWNAMLQSNEHLHIKCVGAHWTTTLQLFCSVYTFGFTKEAGPVNCPAHLILLGEFASQDTDVEIFTEQMPAKK